ncbi:MAG: cytochrome c biogenesis protein ResB [Spirochaetota bacterium]
MLRLTDLPTALYKFFRSMKLAAVLILYLIGLSVWVSFNPQGAGRTVSLVVIVLPVVLFALNMTVCAVSRIIGRLKSGSYQHRLGWLGLGPDFIHIAILLFLIGGLMSHFGRIDGEVQLAADEIAVLNENYMLRLEEFNIEVYEDGRPKQYVSSVQLLRREAGQPAARTIDTAEVSVNNPYSFGRLKIYQRSYSDATENGVGDGNRRELASVLQAVYDPGYPAILSGMLLFLVGMFFVAADKILQIRVTD